MQTVTKCNLCGSSSFKKFFDSIDRLHGKEGKFVYVKCNECGLVFQNPVLDSKELINFYPEDYSPHQAKEAKSEKKKQKIKTKVPKDVLEKLNSKSDLLDVGCGNGKFLNDIRSFTNCRVYGVDFSENAAKIAKNFYGLEVFCGTIEQAPFAKKSFDIITAWSFLEHVPNPSEVVKKFHALLKDKGDCVINCPNFNSLNAMVFGDKWYHLDSPRHLFVFSPETIRILFKKNGFKVKKIIFEKSSKGLVNSLQYYFYENNYSPRSREKIKKSRIIKALTSPLTRIFAMLGKADTMIVHAIKT